MLAKSKLSLINKKTQNLSDLIDFVVLEQANEKNRLDKLLVEKGYVDNINIAKALIFRKSYCK